MPKNKRLYAVVLILIIALLTGLGAAYYYVRHLKRQVSTASETEVRDVAEAPAIIAEEDNISANTVTLHLKNGSSISGALIRETPSDVIINWKDGEIGFSRNEIEHIEYGKKIEEEEDLLFPEEKEKWPYQNDIVVELTNLTVLDAEIAAVLPDKIITRYPLEGGGSIEQEIERAKIENLVFRPVDNDESGEIEKRLREQFPKLQAYTEGLFTIFTDSSNIWAKDYKKVLKRHMTDFYFTYFKLLKDKLPKRQNFVVVFDYCPDYYDYALTDGVPGDLVYGYYMPLDKVLYTANYLGEAMEDWIHDIVLSGVREKVDYIEDSMKGKGEVDKRYNIFIEGVTDEVKGKFVKIINLAKNFHRELTFRVLRHEATHELFHNWGLQTIIMSEVETSSAKIAEKKKKYLEIDWETDEEKKREILRRIWKQREEMLESFEAEASNSWFKEGLATYSELSPIGTMNELWLYAYQDALAKNLIQPLEQLTVYELGSFSGVSSEAKYASYGQSWAFTYFLMKNYTGQFMDYLKRMAAETAEDQEDLTWLIDSLGKDLREIEKEFFDYMDQFEKAKDPDFELKLNNAIVETFYMD